MLTEEQQAFANHLSGVFVEACPGSGKTLTIVARIDRIAATLPTRRGIAVISFTNTAIETFIRRCHTVGLDSVLRYPGFIGTFDAFIRHFFFAPGGIDGITLRPTVVDSWKTLKIDIRLQGANAFNGPGVGLDLFDAKTNRIDPASISHIGLRAHVQNHLAAYQQTAERRRRALRQNGYLSAADVRVVVVQRLQRADWSAVIGGALRARFQEVIVDEAQDCNPLDCQIIKWLRRQNIAVTVVSDPDQAIFEFRDSNPAELRAVGDEYDAQDRLILTGNFRSSPPICNVAATLRARVVPDRSIGDTAAITAPVQILFYQGATIPDSIGRWFCEQLEAAGINKKEGIILAHARKTALRACGSGAEADAGESKVADMARAVGIYWSSSGSGRARESAICIVERSLLDLMGKINDGEIPLRAAENRGINPRWLRRCALLLVSQLPRTCADNNDARIGWISALRDQVRDLHLVYRDGISEAQYFRNRAGANWQRLLTFGETSGILTSTVHEAKGKEYEAVCVVIPPDHGEPHWTEQLVTRWESREDHEAKRVIYVGITRAKKLGVIAIPSAFRGRLSGILQAAQANWQTNDL